MHVWAPRLSAFGGGIGACARQVVRALRSGGCVVSTCAKDDPCRAGARAAGAGCVPGWLRTPAFALLAAWRAWRERPDLIVSLHVNFGPLAVLLDRWLGVPFVVVAHGVEIAPELSPARRASLARARAIWPVSDWTRHRVHALGVDHARMQVIGNTFDADAFHPARARAGNPCPVLLTVARMDPGEGYKGCDVVLHALAVLGQRGCEALYRVVGAGGDLPRLQALAANLGLERHVRWEGQVSDADLRAAYQAADVFVMPSRGEGFGIVFLEAMASGTPVVGGNADGTVDALQGGALGRLVDPTDPLAVADALQDLLARRAPAFWFQPEALRSACMQAHGPDAFDARVQRALRAALGGTD